MGVSIEHQNLHTDASGTSKPSSYRRRYLRCRSSCGSEAGLTLERWALSRKLVSREPTLAHIELSVSLCSGFSIAFRRVTLAVDPAATRADALPKTDPLSLDVEK